MGQITEAIESLQTACGLWRGEPLFGLPGSYFANVALRLSEERLAALEMLLDLQARTGSGALVIGELAQLVEEYPMREPFRASLMTALHNSGRTVDALTVFEDWRRLAADSYGLDPSSDIKELHMAILQGGRVHAGLTDGVVNVAPANQEDLPYGEEEPVAVEAGSRRKYLPHDTMDFSGRQGEIERLQKDARAAPSSALAILAINGMGGVGKTALAVKFAHAAAPDYPDGQYFVDLQGFATERGPLGPADALDVLLQQHGLPPESIPPDLDARSAVWRAEMAGKKAIILLDNAVDTKQVRPLLPGAGGPLVVVTSRRRLVTLVSASSMSLGPLDLQDARRLFVRIAGADRASADDGGVSTIVEHCGRLPLAIRIAAARFRDRPSWTLSYLTRLFEGAKRRLPLLQSEDAGVGAALALSHSHLPSETARLFRLLSVCPGPEFDVRAAAAIARVTEDEAGMVLESLFDDNLILQDDPGWYSFHDLIRECATELCALLESEQDVQLAHERLVDSYLSRATVWCEGLARGPFRREADVDHIWPTDPEEPVSEPESYEVLGRHSRNLIETARSALGRSTPRRAWQMVCAIQPLLRQRNYPGDSLELFEQAASKARDIEDLEGESLCLMGMALVLRERFQIERAMKTFEDALALSRQAGDADLEMSLLTELGIAMVQGERHEEARRYFEQAQRAARELDEKGLLAALSTNLGVVCRALGASAEGLGHLDRALRDHRELGEPLMQAMDLLNIGAILLQDGRFAESEKHLTEASRMECLFVGQAGMISATAYAHLAVVRRILGDDSMSADNGRNALALARELHMPDIECEALNALGESFLGAGDLQGAEASFRQAILLSRNRNLRSLEARAQEGFAHIHLQRNALAMALLHFEQAVDAYPPAVVGVRNPMVHLADIDNRDVRCMRCLRHIDDAAPASADDAASTQISSRWVW